MAGRPKRRALATGDYDFARRNRFTRALRDNPWTERAVSAARRPGKRRRSWGLRAGAWYAGRPKRRFRGRAFVKAPAPRRARASARSSAGGRFSPSAASIQSMLSYLRMEGVPRRDAQRHLRDLRRNGNERTITEWDRGGRVFYIVSRWVRGNLVTSAKVT